MLYIEKKELLNYLNRFLPDIACIKEDDISLVLKHIKLIITNFINEKKARGLSDATKHKLS
jgi:hypothetical protein